jgi:hypothetical protein
MKAESSMAMLNSNGATTRCISSFQENWPNFAPESVSRNWKGEICAEELQLAVYTGETVGQTN